MYLVASSGEITTAIPLLRRRLSVFAAWSKAPVVGPTMMPSVRASRMPASKASWSSTAMISSIKE